MPLNFSPNISTTTSLLRLSEWHRRWLLYCEDPQPGRQDANPPAGFIGMHYHTTPDHFNQFLIDRAGSLGQTLIGLTPTTAGSLADQRHH